MHIVQIVSIVLRRWWVLVLCAAIGLGIAYFTTSKGEVRYESSVTMQLNPSGKSALLPYSGEGTRYQGDITTLAASYTELLRSRTFGQVVVDQLGLDVSPGSVGGSIQTRLIPNTNIMRLTVSSDTRQKAERLAQGITEVFISENLRRQGDSQAQQRLAEMESLIISQRAAMDALRDRRDELYAEVAGGDTARLTELNTIESRLGSLQSSYSNLLVESNRTRTTFDTASILDPATPARALYPPSRLQGWIGGLLTGLAVGIGLAIFLEQIDTRLRSPEHVAAMVEGSPIGMIGRIGTRRWPKAVRRSRLVSLYAERSAGAEAFRTLRTNLRFVAPDQRLHSLIVTSPNPSEGKTLVASNVAVSFAQAGRRVLLVDADLRRPAVHTVFGVPNERGLMDALVRDLDASGHQTTNNGATQPLSGEDLGVLATRVENLWVLPSGPIPQNPSLILGSENLLHIMEELKRRYDLLIVDSAPLGPVADSLLIAPRVDGAVLVARSYRTRRAGLQRAISALTQTGCPVFGVVLNDIRVGLIDRYTDSYYYTYGKQYYGSPTTAKAARKNGLAGAPESVLPGGRGSRSSA